MAGSLRALDTTTESEIGKFLDQKFYPIYTFKSQRFTDVETQMKGIDVVFEMDGSLHMVDEKAASHYINKNLPTFAFEVDFLVRGEVVDGWFFDEHKSTQYYLLTWVWATKDKHITAEDITSVELFLVERRKLLSLLAQYKLTRETASNISKQIRQSGVSGVSHKIPGIPFYFFFSPYLAEQPVNIVIRKEFLKSIASKTFIINK